MPSIDRLSMNLATLREQCGLREAAEACRAAGIPAIAPWRDQVAKTGLQTAARIVQDLGLRVSSLCRGGAFPAATREARQKRIDDNLRAIEEAAALNADCLVLVVGGLPEGSKDLAGARTMVEAGIAAVLEEAQAAKVPLAIEPLHPMYAADRACINSLRQAIDLCERLGPGLGVAVDVYHVWWDPELEAQLARCGPDRILSVHLCDWLVPTRDLLLDRGMMGDGIIDLPKIRGWIDAVGYEDWYEVEIFSNENWWKRPPSEVIATCVERFISVC